MDEMMTNVVEEAAVETTENVVEEAAKSFDLMQFGVKGLCITGGIAIIGGIAWGAKTVYSKWIKPRFKKAKTDPATEADVTEEADVIDLREETEDKKG